MYLVLLSDCGPPTPMSRERSVVPRIASAGRVSVCMCVRRREGRVRAGACVQGCMAHMPVLMPGLLRTKQTT